MKSKNKTGLPSAIIFQHLENPPSNRVNKEFLEKNVWWWRIPDVGLQVWLQDMAEGWPNCKLHEFLHQQCPANQVPESREKAEDFMLTVCKSSNSESLANKHNRECWWEHELDAAKGYELEARDKGSYPCGVPYILLTPAQRNEWKNKYWQLNLNSTPPIWKEGNPPYDWDTDKLTSLFHVSLGHFASGDSVGVRFNLRHGNGWLTRAFKPFIVQERKRLGISNTEELRRKDPVRIREFKQFVTNERKRLCIPNPKHEGKDRRPLNRSWADIENIDIKTHCNQKTTSCTRQRESVTRRKLTSQSARQREIVDWKLTIL